MVYSTFNFLFLFLTLVLFNTYMFMATYDIKITKYLFPPFYLWMSLFYLYILNQILKNEENLNLITRLQIYASSLNNSKSKN